MVFSSTAFSLKAMQQTCKMLIAVLFLFINSCITQLTIQHIYSNYLFPIKVNKVLMASGGKMWNLICANLPKLGEY